MRARSRLGRSKLKPRAENGYLTGGRWTSPVVRRRRLSLPRFLNRKTLRQPLHSHGKRPKWWSTRVCRRPLRLVRAVRALPQRGQRGGVDSGIGPRWHRDGPRFLNGYTDVNFMQAETLETELFGDRTGNRSFCRVQVHHAEDGSCGQAGSGECVTTARVEFVIDYNSRSKRIAHQIKSCATKPIEPLATYAERRS